MRIIRRPITGEHSRCTCGRTIHGAQVVLDGDGDAGESGQGLALGTEFVDRSSLLQYMIGVVVEKCLDGLLMILNDLKVSLR